MPDSNVSRAGINAMLSGNPPLFKVRRAELSLGGRRVLHGLEFEVAEAGISAIMGPNGAGKSLSLRLLAGLISADSGEVSFRGQAGSTPQRIGFVFQKPVLLRRSVKSNLIHALKTARCPRAGRDLEACRLLERGGLTHLADAPARKLSGGEQQRLALVRALACNPEVLFLDEPSASLDPQATLHIETMVREVAQQGVKVILVTHDQGQAKRLADEIIFLSQGKHAETRSVCEFFKNPDSPQAKAYLEGRLLVDV